MGKGGCLLLTDYSNSIGSSYSSAVAILASKLRTVDLCARTTIWQIDFSFDPRMLRYYWPSYTIKSKENSKRNGLRFNTSVCIVCGHSAVKFSLPRSSYSDCFRDFLSSSFVVVLSSVVVVVLSSVVVVLLSFVIVVLSSVVVVLLLLLLFLMLLLLLFLFNFRLFM